MDNTFVGSSSLLHHVLMDFLKDFPREPLLQSLDFARGAGISGGEVGSSWNKLSIVGTTSPRRSATVRWAEENSDVVRNKRGVRLDQVLCNFPHATKAGRAVVTYGMIPRPPSEQGSCTRVARHCV